MSSNIGNLVCIEGIVTKVSLIRPKVVETIHYSEETKQFKTQNYRDATSIVGMYFIYFFIVLFYYFIVFFYFLLILFHF